MPPIPLAQADDRQDCVDGVDRRTERIVLTRQRVTFGEIFEGVYIRRLHHTFLIAPSKRQEADGPQTEQKIQGPQWLVPVADCVPQGPLPCARCPTGLANLRRSSAMA